MKTDVVIKTWWNDLSFCSYAIRFLEKYWNEPDSDIIVLANANCRQVCEDWRFSERVKYFYLDPWPDGNQFQGYLTFLADHFSGADIFAFMDSDCILQERMKASDKMVDGKIVIWYEPEEELLKNPGRVAAYHLWFPIMEHWLGCRPHADFMCRFPLMYWSSTIRRARRIITRKTGTGLLEALYSDVPYQRENFGRHPFRMCEHNVLGFHAFLHEQNRYEFKPMVERSWPVQQYWSWGDWSQERQNEFEALLAQ